MVGVAWKVFALSKGGNRKKESMDIFFFFDGTWATLTNGLGFLSGILRMVDVGGGGLGAAVLICCRYFHGYLNGIVEARVTG